MDKQERERWKQAYDQLDSERIALHVALNELRDAVMADVPGHYRTPRIFNALAKAEELTRPK